MKRYVISLLTKHKKKRLPQRLQGTWFDEWMSYGYITFISAFIFQGMLYANWRENVIKILLDGMMTCLLIFMMPWYWAVVCAHFLNFCLNGQFLCVFYHIGAGNNTPEKFLGCVEFLKRSLDQTSAVSAAIAYGSLSKGKWRPSSDIDIRFIPGLGEIAFWKTCLWAVKARAIAFFQGFPLDLFVTTMSTAYKQMNKDELPIIFKDVKDISSKYYQKRMSFEDFRDLFQNRFLINK